MKIKRKGKQIGVAVFLSLVMLFSSMASVLANGASDELLEKNPTGNWEELVEKVDPEKELVNAETESTQAVATAPQAELVDSNSQTQTTQIQTTAQVTEIKTEAGTTAAPNTTSLGDVNRDGKVNSKDARIVLRVSARLETLDDESKKIADYDQNGKVNSFDVRCIMRIAAKLDPFATLENVFMLTTAPPTTTEPTTVPPQNRKREFKPALSDRFYTDDAYAAVLYDYDRDEILYDRNMNASVEPASTTKLMTAYVASKYLNADTILTAGDELNLLDWNTSRAGIYRGLRMTFREMLKCLLLPSGCDAAYVIADVAGRVALNDFSVSSRTAVNYFISLMNQEAKKLGMTNSRFTNPDGFPGDDRPYVTAYDMLKVGVAAYGVDLIRETVKLRSADVYDAGGRYFSHFTNTNELLWPSSSRYYAYCVGMKTGSHSSAGQCLVSVATDGSRTFFCVVMRCPDKNARYRALSKLYNQAFAS